MDCTFPEWAVDTPGWFQTGSRRTGPWAWLVWAELAFSELRASLPEVLAGWAEEEQKEAGQAGPAAKKCPERTAPSQALAQDEQQVPSQDEAEE